MSTGTAAFRAIHTSMYLAGLTYDERMTRRTHQPAVQRDHALDWHPYKKNALIDYDNAAVWRSGRQSIAMLPDNANAIGPGAFFSRCSPDKAQSAAIRHNNRLRTSVSTLLFLFATAGDYHVSRRQPPSLPFFINGLRCRCARFILPAPAPSAGTGVPWIFRGWRLCWRASLPDMSITAPLIPRCSLRSGWLNIPQWQTPVTTLSILFGNSS